jgi:hypothetical protein
MSYVTIRFIKTPQIRRFNFSQRRKGAKNFVLLCALLCETLCDNIFIADLVSRKDAKAQKTLCYSVPYFVKLCDTRNTADS